VLLLLSGLLILWTVVQALPWRAISAVAGIPLEVGQPAASETPSHPNLQPLHSIGYVLIPFAAFMSALIYIRDDARYTTFLHILLGAAFAVTTFCITEYLLSPQTLLLQPKIHYLASFTGTFVNPNTAASYFGTMLLLSLSLCLRQLDYVRRHRHMVRAARSDPRLRNFLIYCVWTVVFAVALLLTRSRAGVLSSIVAVVGYTWAYAFATMRARGRSARSIAVSTVSAAAAVILLFAPLAQRVMLRIENEGLWDTGRLCTYRSTWQAIQDHFWLGTGLGTFQDVFPAYRSPQCGMNGYWEMAHSVFLEAWLSLGVAFPVVLAIIYYQLIKTYAYGYRQRQRFRFVPLASLGILALLTLHSLVDFSLQIPGMAVVAALILGASATVSLTAKEPRV
jgi:O-antigen ligase